MNPKVTTQKCPLAAEDSNDLCPPKFEEIRPRSPRMDEVWASSSMEPLRMVDMLGKVDSPLFRVICTLKLQYASSIQFPSQVQDFWTQLAWWIRTSIEAAEITIAVSMFLEAGSTLDNALLRPWQRFRIVLTPALILHFSIDRAHNSIAMSLFTKSRLALSSSLVSSQESRSC